MEATHLARRNGKNYLQEHLLKGVLIMDNKFFEEIMLANDKLEQEIKRLNKKIREQEEEKLRKEKEEERRKEVTNSDEELRRRGIFRDFMVEAMKKELILKTEKIEKLKEEIAILKKEDK